MNIVQHLNIEYFSKGSCRVVTTSFDDDQDDTVRIFGFLIAMHLTTPLPLPSPLIQASPCRRWRYRGAARVRVDLPSRAAQTPLTEWASCSTLFEAHLAWPQTLTRLTGDVTQGPRGVRGRQPSTGSQHSQALRVTKA